MRKWLCSMAAALAFPALAVAAPVQYTGTFDAANNSGVSGTTTLTVDGDVLTVQITASGLEANRNHAQHIHGSGQGGHFMCPSVKDDDTSEHERRQDEATHRHPDEPGS